LTRCDQELRKHTRNVRGRCTSTALLAALLLLGCGLNAHVRPVEKGTLAIEAAVGGPALLVSGAPVPLLLSTVGARYGLVDRLDISLHTHITTLAAYKLFGLDLGLGWLVFDQRGAIPAVDLSARFYFFTDFAQAQSAGELSITTSWLIGEQVMPYLTFTVYVDALAGAAHLAPGIGAEFRVGRFAIIPEVRWYAPETSTRGSSVEWLSPGKYGAIGLVLGGRFEPIRR
jgi:hypothetical protein